MESSGVDPPLMKCDVNQTCVDTTYDFVTGQKFTTREEAISWIREVGIRNKVTVIITHSDTKTGKRGRSNKLIFGCDKGGKYKKTDSETQSASKRCGCPFKIRSKPSKDGSGWKIDVKCGVHNHDLPDRFEGHAFVSLLNTDDKQHIVDLIKCHVPPRHILLSMQERDPENVTRITQIYKHKSKIQKDIRGPIIEMQQLLKLVKESGYVYWSRKKDESEVDFCPQVILTDRDLALMKAIETVFPKTTNLLCQFHINKNVKSKCKEYVVDNMRETVEKMWYELIRASDEMEYHQRLKQFEDACVDSKDFIDMVGTDTQKCGCTHRKVYGLPCACELGRYTLSGDAIPIRLFIFIGEN
ncbi:uncharacterized protein LOC131604376 [Vicia villosa]|uniref:uncharacterized protein LOC131604376 n=1 Tax=Vicia villosa TaxID=3911 RepID=UPI00273C8F82|nr:uncharacterized protein LOC131604376 [Vicia villosa]